MRILFIDIDGPLLPEKAKYFDYQKKTEVEHWTEFDPFSVRFYNSLFEKYSDLYGVIHSSWRKFYPDDFLINHFKSQGCEFRFHTDMIAPFKFGSNRWEEINFWLYDHPEIKDYMILDDEVPPEYLKKRTVLVDYKNGLSLNNCRKLNYWLEKANF